MFGAKGVHKAHNESEYGHSAAVRIFLFEPTKKIVEPHSERNAYYEEQGGFNEHHIRLGFARIFHAYNERKDYYAYYVVYNRRREYHGTRLAFEFAQLAERFNGNGHARSGKNNAYKHALEHVMSVRNAKERNGDAEAERERHAHAEQSHETRFESAIFKLVQIGFESRAEHNHYNAEFGYYVQKVGRANERKLSARHGKPNSGSYEYTRNERAHHLRKPELFHYEPQHFGDEQYYSQIK